MSNVLEGFEVINRDECPGVVKSRMGKVVLAFLESGNECMGKRYDDLSELRRDVDSARQFVKYKPSRKRLGVRVSKRGDMLFLMREREEGCGE